MVDTHAQPRRGGGQRWRDGGFGAPRVVLATASPRTAPDPMPPMSQTRLLDGILGNDPTRDVQGGMC